MYDSLSAVDCLRKALGNLRDLFVSIQTKYSESLAYVCSPHVAPLLRPGRTQQVACSSGVAAAHGVGCKDARLHGWKAIARPTRMKLTPTRAREFTVFKDIDIREAVDAQVAESRAKTAKKNAGGSKKSGSASTANGASAGTTAGDVEMS